MASTQSFSSMYLLISDSPLPAAPVNREDPLWIIAILPSSFNFLSPFKSNNIWPSDILGSPIPNLPLSPSLCSSSTDFFSTFHSIPNGGLEIT